MRELINGFPRQAAFPRRRMVKTETQFYELIDKYNKIKDCYYSLYPLDEHGAFGHARVDKLFFDFDGKDAQEHTKRLCNYLYGRDIRHLITFSGCVLPGAVVYINGNARLIENVEENEQVLTHTGTYKKIEFCSKNQHDGDVYRIKPYCTDEAVFTPEHPLLVVRRGSETPEWLSAKSLKRLDYVLFPKPKPLPERGIEFLDLKDYVDFDYEVEHGMIVEYVTRELTGNRWGEYDEPKISRHRWARAAPVPYKIPLNNDVLELIGWFIAEGHECRLNARSNNVIITLNADTEQHIAERLAATWKKYFKVKPHVYVQEQGGWKSLKVRVANKAINRLFKKIKGGKSHQLSLPSWWTKLSHEQLKTLINAYWEGDKGATTSKKLAHELMLALRTLGEVPTMRVRNSQKHRAVYHVSRDGQLSGKGSKLKQFGNYIGYPIQRITREQYKGPVYNFSVSEDESYLTNGFATHNCKGFHVYIFTINYEHLRYPKDALKNAQRHFEQQAKAVCDESVIGDVARVARVPNTWHVSGKRYCIPLTHADLDKEWAAIKERAKQQRFRFTVYGTKMVDMKQFDTPNRERHEAPDMPTYSYNIEVDDQVVERFHPCVQHWLLQPEQYCTNKTRYFFAKYCSVRGLPPKLCDELARKYWSGTRESGGVRTKYQEFKDEGQIKRAYGNDKPMPNCDSLARSSYCPGKCKEYAGRNFPLYHIGT